MSKQMKKIFIPWAKPDVGKEELNEITTNIAVNVNECYKNCGKPPILIGVLNGSFIFLADLVKKIL